MKLEKVINPALQQGQDSSIKPVHKDSSIFNYCLQSAEESLKKKSLVVCKREGFRDPRSQQLLFLIQRRSDTLSCWWIRSVYLYDKHCKAAHLLENGSVSQGLNERLGSRDRRIV